MLSPQTWPNYRGSAKDGVQILCQALQLGSEDYRMGKTKIFIRSPNTVFSLFFSDGYIFLLTTNNKKVIQI